MGARADAAVHHGDLHAALVQRGDHVGRADAGAVRLEEDKVGFRLLHLDALNL
jgi:hypothetical protein